VNLISLPKKSVYKVIAWLPFAAALGLVTGVAPSVDNRFVDLVNTLIVSFNIVVIYFSFIIPARSVFVSNERFLDVIKLSVRKDLLTVLVGVILFCAVLVNVPALATQGTWHLPQSMVAIATLLGSFFVLLHSAIKLYEIQYLEVVLTPKESSEYKKALENPSREKSTGMFLSDINNKTKNLSNKLTRFNKPKKHKMFLPFLQTFLILFSPGLLLFWVVYILDLQTYTYVSAIASPVIISIASAFWAWWHIQGGMYYFVKQNARNSLYSGK